MLMEYQKYCKTMRFIAMFLLFMIVLDECYLYVYSLWDVMDQVIEYFGFKDYITTFSSLIITAFAILYLAIAKPKDISRIMIVCVLVVAYDSIMDAYLMLVEYRSYGFSDLSLFLMGAFNLVISLMLFINAFIYSRGLSRSTSLTKYSVIALLLLIALMFIADFRSGQTIIDTIDANRDTIPLFLMLLFILSILSSKSVKLRTISNTIKESISDLRNSMVAVGIGIERNIALRLSDFNAKGLWCDSYSFILTTFYRDDYIMTLERYGDTVLARISSVDNHTGMNNFRFHMKGIWTDTGDIGTCDLMRFYGEDGLFIQMIVRESETHPRCKVPKIDSIILSSREQGTLSNKIMTKFIGMKAAITGMIGRKRVERPE